MRVVMVLFLTGLVVWATGFLARSKYNPESVVLGDDVFEIVTSEEGEVYSFTMKTKEREGFTLSGSTDYICDLPYLVLIDVDLDGEDDLYFHHCGGHGYVTVKSGIMKYIDMGQQDPEDIPASGGWWWNLVLSRGGSWMVAGSLMMVMALAGFLILFLGKNKYRKV